VGRRAAVASTYYFPTRDDLLEAVTERAVEGIAGGLRRVVMDEERSPSSARPRRIGRVERVTCE
jgi:AcrR family transcriptional regulator